MIMRSGNGSGAARIERPCCFHNTRPCGLWLLLQFAPACRRWEALTKKKKEKARRQKSSGKWTPSYLPSDLWNICPRKTGFIEGWVFSLATQSQSKEFSPRILASGLNVWPTAWTWCHKCLCNYLFLAVQCPHKHPQKNSHKETGCKITCWMTNPVQLPALPPSTSEKVSQEE